MNRKLLVILFLIIFSAVPVSADTDLKAASINLNMNISAYKMTVTGSVDCEENISVFFSVINQTDNTEIINQNISGSAGIYNVNFTLPSLLNQKNYKIILNFLDVSKNLLLGTVDLSAQSGTNIGITGTSRFADNARMNAQITSNHSSIINKSKTLTGTKNYDYGIVNVLSFASISISADLFAVDIPVGDSVYTITMNEVDKNGNAVNVSGSISGGSGKSVTIMVVDALGEIVYINQEKSTLNGNYSFTFEPADYAREGTLTVMVCGENVGSVTSRTFTYTKQGTIIPSDEIRLTVNLTPNKEFWVAINDDLASIGSKYTLIYDPSKIGVASENFFAGDISILYGSSINGKSYVVFCCNKMLDSSGIYSGTLGFVKFGSSETAGTTDIILLKGDLADITMEGSENE